MVTTLLIQLLHAYLPFLAICTASIGSASFFVPVNGFASSFLSFNHRETDTYHSNKRGILEEMSKASKGGMRQGRIETTRKAEESKIILPRSNSQELIALNSELVAVVVVSAADLPVEREAWLVGMI